MDDESYETIFVPIMTRVLQTYEPTAIVLQCGADSLSGDRLGDFNLTFIGHGRCVEFIRRFNIPMMLLGGGGYTVKNVSRCWAYETSIALNVEISNDLPETIYDAYFSPEMKLHIERNEKIINKNSPQHLRELIEASYEKLRIIEPVPSVQMHSILADATMPDFEAFSREMDPDERLTTFEEDRMIIPDNEF